MKLIYEIRKKALHNLLEYIFCLFPEYKIKNQKYLFL